MKVFLGCSSSHLFGKDSSGTINNPKDKKEKLNFIRKENSLAKFLVSELFKQGNSLYPWWEEDTFVNGEYFLNKIILLSKSCDTGIFILDQEIEKKAVNSNSANYISNQNVILELGIFIAQKGINNVIFIAESDVEIPSDFSGINVIKYNVSNQTKENFENLLSTVSVKLDFIVKNSTTDFLNAEIFFNYDTNTTIIKDNIETRNWNGKSAYLGLNAAKLWRDIEISPDYLPPEFIYNFRNYLKSIKNYFKETSNVISLGSGVGTLDEEILKIIKFDNPIRYIPIEINPYLALMALNRITRSKYKLKSSFAIIDDFEEQNAQLFEFLDKQIIQAGETSLYTFLGGTFCNIDDQNSFLNDWSDFIDSNDYFLFDAFVYRDNYSISDDMVRITQEFVMPIINNVVEHKFNTTEDFKKSARVCEYLSLSKEKRKELFFKSKTNENPYVEIEMYPKNFDKNKSVTFVYKFNGDNELSKSNVSTLFKVKRHNKIELKSKVEKYFKLIDTKEVLTNNEIPINEIPINEQISRIYFLCKKKK